MDRAGRQLALAQSWNGTRWALQSIPSPAAPASVVELTGVACSADGSCLAVGDYYDAAGVQVPLVERWESGSWTIHTIPAPSGAQGSQLHAISCSAATTCTAVGSYTDAGGQQLTLAERWNGTAWAIQTTPNPATTGASELGGVSCPAADSCTAVGEYADSSGTETALAERWNGTIWAIQTFPASTDPYVWGTFLTSVSCTSPKACTAVGHAHGDAHENPVAARWDGTSWTLQDAGFGGGTGEDLQSVSCPTANSCVAVGEYYIGEGFQTSDVWNGSTWTTENPVQPANHLDDSLVGVSCTKAANCWAVGENTGDNGATATMAQRWNGTKWALHLTPNRTQAATSGLKAVACITETNCFAVGSYASGVYYDGAAVQTPLIEHWSGTSWSVQPTPSITGNTFAALTGIACRSASLCIAVGYDQAGSGSIDTLIERWDGHSWTIQSSPNVSAASITSLAGVSCGATNACIAVGYDEASNTTIRPLVERWDGSSWSLQPPPVDIAYKLAAVSCSSPNACTAVGGTLLRYNGTTWKRQSAPITSGLSGVSCTSGKACTAVGAGPIAEHWDGTTWTEDTLPSGLSTNTSLTSVSCTSAQTCTAVSNGTFALHEDGGSWTEQTVPSPVTRYPSLSGVWCDPAGVCEAVGSDTTGYWGGGPITLAEQYSPS